MIKLQLLVLILIINVSCCGFQKRTSNKLPPELQNIVFAGYNNFDLFARTIYDNLRQIGANVIIDNLPHKEANFHTLTIKNYKLEEKPLVYGFDGQASFNIITLTFEFEFLNKTHQINVERDIGVNASNILVTNEERQRINHQLYLDASRAMSIKLLNAPIPIEQ